MGKETATQRKRRLEKARQSYKAKISNDAKKVKLDQQDQQLRENETPKKRTIRLRNERQRISQQRAAKETLEIPQERTIRLENERQRISKHRAVKKALETPQECAVRLEEERQRKLQQRAVKDAFETPHERAIRLEEERQRNSQQRAAKKALETPHERAIRLENERQRISKHRVVEDALETPHERAIRLEEERQRKSQLRADETSDEREIHLERDRTRRQILNSNFAAFENAIYSFCDKFCDICAKRCYPNQISTNRFSDERPSFLPSELSEKNVLLLCHRCKSYVSSRNQRAPSKAYWNNLDPGVIPNTIQVLTQSEQRLLSRIIPFVKVIKFDGSFGHYGFKGQAILFAQDIFEISEKLPNMLPRSVEDTSIIIITEDLENLNITRAFSISRTRVYDALRWLIKNNPLYIDVTIDYNTDLNDQALVRVNGPAVLIVPNNDQQATYVPINEFSRILRASWRQASTGIFNQMYIGIQCCAMVLANIVRASVLRPVSWTKNILDRNMIEGDNIYTMVRTLSEQQEDAYPIDNGYLLARNFDVIKHDFTAFVNHSRLTMMKNQVCLEF